MSKDEVEGEKAFLSPRDLGVPIERKYDDADKLNKVSKQLFGVEYNRLTPAAREIVWRMHKVRVDREEKSACKKCGR